jgi:hypothetical protein
MTTRVAIYARVSTVNHGQDVSMQTRELRQFANSRRRAAGRSLVNTSTRASVALRTRGPSSTG